MPVKCSTVKKIDKINSYCQYALLGAYGGLFFALITNTGHTFTIEGYFKVFAKFVAVLSLIGFLGCIYFAFLFISKIVEEWDIECIKDEPEEP